MPLDHERLDVYKVTITFIAWVADTLDGPLANRKSSAMKHLDSASQSIANNIAEGNASRSATDRARFLDIAMGSALECGACLDGLVARKMLESEHVANGKEMLVRIVSMLCRMVEKLRSR